MKFIHIADVHLGAVPDSNMPWAKSREKEIWSSFAHIITVCNEEKVDFLFIAGDLFHRQALVRELKEVNYLFSKLETTQVVLMAGNHDFIGNRSNYVGFEWVERVHMFLSDQIEVASFPELKTEVYGFSYHTRDIVEARYDNLKSEGKDNIQILLAHGGDEKDIPINRRKLQDSVFDYIALGHLHKPEIISNKMAYPGSFEPLDKNETGERGYIVGEITVGDNGKKTTQIRFVSNAVREYKRRNIAVDQTTTNGSLQDLVRDLIKSEGAQHIYSFCITGVRDEIIHFDKEAVKTCGNVLEVEDQSVPDYDFDLLHRENADNIIGLFIQRIRENPNRDEIEKKALYYGIEALLGAKV